MSDISFGPELVVHKGRSPWLTGMIERARRFFEEANRDYSRVIYLDSFCSPGSFWVDTQSIVRDLEKKFPSTSQAAEEWSPYGIYI